jgi:hypothetical protein
MDTSLQAEEHVAQTLALVVHRAFLVARVAVLQILLAHLQE